MVCDSRQRWNTARTHIAYIDINAAIYICHGRSSNRVEFEILLDEVQLDFLPVKRQTGVSTKKVQLQFL